MKGAFNASRSRRTVLLSALAAPAVARAQSDFPNRSIRLVIPWPPGASADAFLRSIADQAGKRLGQTVVPDNKPGANGTFGAIALKDAKPDGYTLAQIHTGVVRAQLMAEQPSLRRADRLQLHHPALGLGARHRRARRQPLQDAGGACGRRQGQPRQAELRHVRPVVGPEHDHGRPAAAAGHRADARALSRRQRALPGPFGQADRRHRRRQRLDPAGAERPVPPARRLGLQPHEAVPRGADPQGSGHRPGGELALRHLRPQGHGPGRS